MLPTSRATLVNWDINYSDLFSANILINYSEHRRHFWVSQACTGFWFISIQCYSHTASKRIERAEHVYAIKKLWQSQVTPLQNICPRIQLLIFHREFTFNRRLPRHLIQIRAEANLFLMLLQWTLSLSSSSIETKDSRNWNDGLNITKKKNFNVISLFHFGQLMKVWKRSGAWNVRNERKIFHCRDIDKGTMVNVGTLLM